MFRNQRLFDTLGRIGQGLIAAGSRGASTLPGLAMGMGQGGGGGGNGLIDMMKMQAMLDDTRARQDARQKGRAQTASQEALGAGDRYDPRTNILWNQAPQAGRKPPTASPDQRRALAARAYPEAYGKAMAAREFPGPTEYNAAMTVLDKNGVPTLIRVPKGAGAPVPLGGGYQPDPATGSGNGTALMQNAAFLVQELGIPMAEAIEMLRESKSKSREQVVFDLAARSMVAWATPMEKAQADAEALYDKIFSPAAPGADAPAAPAPAPDKPTLWEQGMSILRDFTEPQTTARAAPPASPASGPIVTRPAAPFEPGIQHSAPGMGLAGPGPVARPAVPAVPRPTPMTPQAVAPTPRPARPPMGMGLAGPGLQPRPPVPPATIAEPPPELPQTSERVMTKAEISDFIDKHGDQLTAAQLVLLDEHIKALGL